MHDLHRIAQLLAASWRLADPSGARMPTSHGILDRALDKMCTDNLLPQWASEQLHFVDSRIGLQCVELPSILEIAQAAQLISAPNPSYRTAEIQISESLAKKIIGRLDLQVEAGRLIGEGLRKAVGAAAEEMSEFQFQEIEEY